MNWHSARFRLSLLLIIIVVIVGGGIAIVYLRAHAPITTVWHAPTRSFTQQDQHDIQTALNTALSTPNPGNVAGHEFTIIDAQRQGEWAVFSANERVTHDAPAIPTEPLFFIAHQQGTTWTIWMPSSPGFCDQLKQLPDTLLTSSDKHYFLGCYE